MGGTARPWRPAFIRVGFPVWPPHIARPLGFFDSEEIVVQSFITGSSVRQMEALCNGGFDVGIQLPDHVVRAVARGSDLFAFMAPAHAADISLIAVKGVQSLGDLKGRIIAVDGARSGYALLLRRMLRAAGVGDGDWQAAAIGGTKERVEALREARAEAAFINPPFDAALLADGFVRLSSTVEAFPDYPGIVAAARREWAQTHGEELKRFVRAYRRAILWLSDAGNRDVAIDVARQSFGVDSAEALRAFDAQLGQAEPALTAAGMGEVIDVVWESEGLSEPRLESGRVFDLALA